MPLRLAAVPASHRSEHEHQPQTGAVVDAMSPVPYAARRSDVSAHLLLANKVIITMIDLRIWPINKTFSHGRLAKEQREKQGLKPGWNLIFYEGETNRAIAHSDKDSMIGGERSKLVINATRLSFMKFAEVQDNDTSHDMGSS